MVKGMLKILALALVLLPLLVVLCGQFGLFAGKTPEGLGVHDGMLKAPRNTPNSVSSQARLRPTHPRHLESQIEPLAYTGNGPAAVKRLAGMVTAMPRTKLVKQDPDYLYFECATRWLKFIDDVEFLLDESAQVIHVRSASRLGRRDFDVNRERVESIRKLFMA